MQTRIHPLYFTWRWTNVALGRFLPPFSNPHYVNDEAGSHLSILRWCELVRIPPEVDYRWLESLDFLSNPSQKRAERTEQKGAGSRAFVWRTVGSNRFYSWLIWGRFVCGVHATHIARRYKSSESGYCGSEAARETCQEYQCWVCVIKALALTCLFTLHGDKSGLMRCVRTPILKCCLDMWESSVKIKHRHKWLRVHFIWY